jgi:hypothetical protein
MSNFLNKICDQIVDANIKKQGQQMSPDQKQQQEQQNQEPPNAAPVAPTAEAPKAPVAPTAVTPTAPVAPTAMNPNPNPPADNEANNEANNNAPEPITDDTVIPEDITNGSQKSNTFSELVGDVINDSLSNKRKAYNHFKQEHIKKAILDEMDGKHCVVSFACSNDMFPAKMDSKTYDDFANNGMSNIFDVVDDTIKNFSISITTEEEKIMSHMKELAVTLHEIGFNCVVLFKDNAYEMQFSSDKEVNTQDVLNVVLEKIDSFAKEFNDSIFNASELNKGNLRDVSRFAPLDKLLEL